MSNLPLKPLKWLIRDNEVLASTASRLYVKPSPTWIDVNERLPERKELLSDKDKCLVLTECGKVWTGFYNMQVKPDDWYLHGWTEKQGWHPFKIIAWMLASEFSEVTK